jgi:hypothetical protein
VHTHCAVKVLVKSATAAATTLASTVQQLWDLAGPLHPARKVKAAFDVMH